MEVLFVCHGNTCRSPTAATVTRDLLARRGVEAILVSSAGTQPRHEGDPPNKLAVAEGQRRGYTIEGRARRLTPALLANADLVIAMEQENLEAIDAILRGADPEDHPERRLFLDFVTDRAPSSPIPDPWGKGVDAYCAMVDAVEEAARALVGHLAPTDEN